jgi:hypothetical protein
MGGPFDDDIHAGEAAAGRVLADGTCDYRLGLEG